MITSNILQHAKNAKAMVVFAHGAGADKSSEFMENVAAGLLTKGISVLRFNFPYMDKRLEDGKRRPPERMPKLLPCFADHINALNTHLPIFIGGKSMGSRVAAMLTSEDELPIDISLAKKVVGTFCLGYPFHPPTKPDNLRLSPLMLRSDDVLILQGTRDKLGSEDDIVQYNLPKACKLVFLPDGDHDLKPRVKSGFTHQGHIAFAVNVIESYIDEKLSDAK